MFEGGSGGEGAKGAEGAEVVMEMEMEMENLQNKEVKRTNGDGSAKLAIY